VYWKQFNHLARVSHTLPCVYIHCNSARKTLFPDAKPFEARSKAAIVSENPPLGAPTKSHVSAVHSVNRTIVNVNGLTSMDGSHRLNGLISMDGSHRLNGLTSMDGSHRVSHFAAETAASSDHRHSQRRFSPSR